MATGSTDAVVDAFETTDDPVLTAAEVAETTGVTRRTALRQLKALEAAGRVRSKKVGGRAKVWWRVEGEAASEERSLLELAGILTDEEADGLEAAIEDRRTRRHDDLEEIADEMGSA